MSHFKSLLPRLRTQEFLPLKEKNSGLCFLGFKFRLQERFPYVKSARQRTCSSAVFHVVLLSLPHLVAECWAALMPPGCCCYLMLPRQWCWPILYLKYRWAHSSTLRLLWVPVPSHVPLFCCSGHGRGPPSRTAWNFTWISFFFQFCNLVFIFPRQRHFPLMLGGIPGQCACM